MKLNWAKRYEEGDCINVWKEITNGQHLVKFEDYKEEINNVINQTIKSTKLNIEILYDRLLKLKYPFKEEYPLNFLNPNRIKSTDKLIQGLNKIDYSLPLLVGKFYEEIGGIDFRRDFEENFEDENLQENVFDKYYTDPFQIYSLDYLSDEEYVNWMIEDYTNKWHDTPRVHICPDFYFKENVSGGGSYIIKIENDKMVNPSLDLCELELDNFTFIDYLRINFKNGGFMGLEFEEDLNNYAIKFREELIKKMIKI